MDRHGYNRAPNKPSGLWVTVQGRDDIPCVAGSKCQTTKHACAFPRRAQRPSPALHAPSIKRAQGMPGAGRTRSLAWKSKNHTSQSPQVRRNDPALPARMVLTVSFVLSPETGLSCLRRRRNIIRRLDASVGASGPHDFAVRKARVLVRNAACVHRIPPTSVTIAKRPSVGTGRFGSIAVSTKPPSEKYFAGGLDTKQVICPSGSHANRTRLAGSRKLEVSRNA